MEKSVAKVFYMKTVLVGGVPTDKLFNVTTPAGDQGNFVKSLCNGLPFWWFASVPTGTIIGCDFSGAPVATGDATTNNTLIAAITVAPLDVLTYQ